MEPKTRNQLSSAMEVNLKSFFQKVFKHKWLFLGSIAAFVSLALAYIALATPKYEVSTSILIDPSGSNRLLGESKYVDGAVGLIEMEKNLYNEIGIIKSFSLINQTVKDLDFDVTYHAGSWLKTTEYYGYFPFEVDLLKSEAQLYNVPFEVSILSDEKYRLSVEASDFMVSNPTNGSIHEVKRDFYFTRVYSFGEPVNHDYFTFILKKPDYKVNIVDFKKGDLSFVIHNPDAVTNEYMSNIEVNNIDIQASIFKIVSYGPIVDKEVDFLKKLVDNYVQNKLLSRNKIASSKEAFIRNQLAVISDSLLKTELDLEGYKKDQRAINLSATATNALNQSQTLQVDKAKIQLEIDYYNSVIQYVENNRGSDDFVVPTAMGIDDPLISDHLIELKRLYTERSRKKFYVTDSNREMNILNNQINESTELLLGNLRSAIRSSRLALRGVRSQIANYNEVISSLPVQEKQLLSIQRQSNLYENLFNYLSQELAKTGIARAESTSDTTVLDEARMVGDKPVAPQKSLLLVLAVIMGTMVPMTKIVFFSSEDIIEDVGKIMANTDIPVIASIARHNSKSKISDSKISLWRVKESFRDLSANLKFVCPRDTSSVLGITSFMPEEGKTFCSINLGITFAEAGKKTLIIDTDLRSPSLVGEIKKINGKGLSNYLQGDNISLNDIIYPHEKLSNLQFIPTDIIERNVHELLSGTKMESLILKLKEKYDYIILDTPAAGLVSDFVLFSDLIDINLFVVRRKIAKIGFLDHFEKLMIRGKKKKSYIIFNDILEKDYKYGYGHKYGANREHILVKDSLSV